MRPPLDLYELLPAVHRIEDAGLGYPLEALLDIISGQVAHVQRDISGLWDDFFIETAAEWAVPYLADLVGASPLHDVAGSRRADVANTIAYRRRKGTVPMLEDMAGDVTGWRARVVPFFELLEWTQHLDHLRRQPGTTPGRSARVGTVDVGDLDALDLLDGPFDGVAHTVDVRPFSARRGRHNLRRIGFFLWRLRSNPLTALDAAPAPAGAHAWHFSPLGNPAPLFTNDERPDPSQRPAEADLPGPIRPLALWADLALARETGSAASRYYGPGSHHSLAVAVGDATADFGADVVPADEVTVCDLSGWRRPPAGVSVAIDPARGRLTLAEAVEPAAGQVVRVAYCYGFSGAAGADLGGGPYDRRASLDRPRPDDHLAVVARVRPHGLSATTPWFATVDAAVADWLGRSDPARRAVVEVADSATYAESALTLHLPAGHRLEVRAANRQRPVLDVARIEVSADGDGGLVLDGMVVLGGPLRIGAGMTQVAVRHCTLVPGRTFGPAGEPGDPSATSLEAAAVQSASVTVANSIVGPVRLPAEGYVLTVSDSIVDAPDGGRAVGGPTGGPGPTCDLRRLTVFGEVRVESLGYATEAVFTGPVTVVRTQSGCMRFSYVPEGAVTPARYRCQPDLALEGVTGLQPRRRTMARVQPRFTSRRYGQPGYAQLARDTADEIRTGGADEREMGAFNLLREAQREANLRNRLDEYLPAGLEAGLIYES